MSQKVSLTGSNDPYLLTTKNGQKNLRKIDDK